MFAWLLTLALAAPAQPVALKALLRDGLTWSQTHDADGLEQALRTAFEARNPDLDATASVGLLMVRIGAARLADAPEAGLTFMLRGHDAVRRVIPRSDPARWSATRATADALRRHGRPFTAEPLYEALLTYDSKRFGPAHPRTLETAAHLGDALRRQRAFDAALARLEQTRAAAPPTATALRARVAGLLGQVHAALDRPGEADAAFREAATLWGERPAGASDAVAYAAFLSARHRPTAAARALRPYAASDPAAHLALAELLFGQERYDRAHALAKQGLEGVAQGPDDPAALPWLYRLASADGAAGRHDAAEAWIARARAVAKTAKGQYAQWGRPFDDLHRRLRAARALSDQARTRPAAPFTVTPPEPSQGLSALGAPELRVRAVEATKAGRLDEAQQARRRLLTLTDRGRLPLAALASQAGQVDAAFHWLFEAAQREVVDLSAVDASPDFATLRADPRWRGARAWLGRVALHWRVHVAPRATARPSTGAEPWLVVLPDAGSTPEAALEALGGATAIGAFPGAVVAISGTWAVGPSAFRWAERSVDTGHLNRHLDRLDAPDRIILLGLGRSARVAAQLAADDPDRFAGAVLWGPVDDTPAPPLRVGADHQRWVVACAGPLPSTPFTDGVRTLGGVVQCSADTPLMAAQTFGR